MTTPKLDEVRRALDTLTRFVQSFDAFLSPEVARAEGARPAAAIQEPRGRPSAVRGKPGPRDYYGPAILAAMKSAGRPMYTSEILSAVAGVRHGGEATDRETNGVRTALRRLRIKGILKRDDTARLWMLQAKIVPDRAVTVAPENDNKSH